MASFDPSVAQAAARKQLLKSRGKSASVRQRAADAWAAETQSIDSLSRLIDWAENRRVDVVFQNDSTLGLFHPEDDLIVLSTRATRQKQLFVLIHECGHVLIGADERHPKFGAGYPVGRDPQKNRSLEHRMTCLSEEIEAWHRGVKLARKLGLQYDAKKLTRFKNHCLKSYLQWVLNPNKYDLEMR